MVDWKKEIKLSDLAPKRGPGSQPRAADKPRKKRGHASAEIVGLKIGATGIRAALVANNGDKKLLRVAHMPLSAGIVDGGEVRDPSALGAALTTFFASNSLPRKGVRLGLANSRIGVRVIDVAGIDDDRQLENAIGFRAHEMLSVPIEEAVIDYRVLSSGVDESGAPVRKALVVVAYRESVERYLEATAAAKLNLTGIDLEAFALLRAVAAPKAAAASDDSGEESEVALIAVSVGHERTTLAISDGEVCQFARVLEWGGADVGSAIGRALKLGAAEGESLKHGLSLVAGNETVVGLEAEPSRDVVAAVRYEMQNLVRELLSSLRFYQSQPGSLPIGKILLAGGTSMIPGFAEDLGRELGIPARLADPFARVVLGKSVQRPSQPGALAIAVGLGVED
jgi:type IV pilus assembly protein PilM